MNDVSFIPVVLIGAFVFGWFIGKILRVNMNSKRPYNEYRENQRSLNQGARGENHGREYKQR